MSFLGLPLSERGKMPPKPNVSAVQTPPTVVFTCICWRMSKRLKQYLSLKLMPLVCCQWIRSSLWNA